VKRILIAVLVATLVPAGLEAQGRGRGGGPPRSDLQSQSRRMLERQILQRFVEQSGQEMGLNTNARTELSRILHDTNEERRALAVEAVQLRQKLTEALRDNRTTDDQFDDILDEINDLRRREHDLWKREQDRLSKTLTPRQRAQFMVRWLRLQDTIRDMIDQRTGGGTESDLLDTALLDPLYPAMATELVNGGR
jgi:chromosome segregation ATPase